MSSCAVRMIDWQVITVKLACTVLAVVATLLPPSAFAQCVSFDNPEELFVRSESVFVGTVVAGKPTGAQGSHVIVDIGTFRVERAWKGKFPQPTR